MNAGGTFDLGGFSETIGALTGAGNVINSVAGTAGVRDLDASANGEAGRSVRSSLGRIRIDRPGDVVVRVAAERIDDTAGRGLKLQAIELAPA